MSKEKQEEVVEPTVHSDGPFLEKSEREEPPEPENVEGEEEDPKAKKK